MVDPVATDLLSAANRGQRMQRLRVGITGLAFVLLIVAVATAIASGVRRSADAINVATPPAVVATLPSPDNGTGANAEPLAQLGAAPGSKSGSEQPPLRK